MKVPLNHYQLCSGVHKHLCWGHYCYLSTLMMSLKLSFPVAVYCFMLMTLQLLYHPIYCQEDYNSPWNDIDSLCDWTSSAFLNLNAGKCKYIVISRKKQPILPLTPILICGNALERANSFKYLGVWIAKDLTWSRHVTEICTKARRVVGLIYRQYSTPETLNQLYMFLS